VSAANNFKEMKKGLDFNQAVIEADRCLLCHEAPCSKGCPAGTDPATFIRKLRFKNVTGAIRTVKQNNILGGACGVLCPTARLCEKECSATGIDRPIDIGGLQRFLVEFGWETGFEAIPKPAIDKGKVAVVGSGPGGLSCAAELAQRGYAVTVFEARAEPGGVLRYGVVSYRFDRRFLDRELADIRSLGVTFECNRRIAGAGAARALLDQGYKAVFMAPGLWGAARLKPDLEGTPGLYSSVDYLAGLRENRFDALTDEIAGKTVAVIGGGSVAMDCVESAVKLGAADVYLIYRRSWSQMPAEEDERIQALAAGVHYLLLNQPVDYPVAGGRIAGVKMVRTRLGAPDDSGRRSPEPVAGSEWVLPAEVVIEAIGNIADADPSEWVPGVVTDARHRIKTRPETAQTDVPGVFAGGDIVRGPSLVVWAVQDGKIAAEAIHAYLSEQA
jgi:NADPH-dependent glutamate synthase beta subunit-like oxidoreductase